MEDFLGDMRKGVDQFLSDQDTVELLPSDQEKRKKFLIILNFDLPSVRRTTAVIEFLSQVLQKVWEKATKSNAWLYYDVYITIVIDVLRTTNSAKFPPALFTFLADASDRVGFLLDADKRFGSAYAASATWMKRCKEIPPSVMAELKSFANAHGKRGLKRAIGTYDPAEFFSISTDEVAGRTPSEPKLL